MTLIFVYLINLYIRPQDWIPAFYGWPVDYLVIIPALIFALFTKMADEDKVVVNPIYKLLFASLVVIFLSNAVHGNIAFGVEQFTKYLKLVAVFIMVLLLINSTKKLKYAMFFIVILSSFIAYQAISQYISGDFGLAGQDFYHSGVGIRTKWIGLWNGANILALLLSISVAFALEFIFGPYSIIFRLVNIVLAGCLIWGVYTTNSRGGFLTLLAVLFLYPLFRMKRKKVAIVLGMLMAIVALVYLSPSRMGELNTKEESARVRTRLWGNAKDMFIENPILGIGKGKFVQENCRHLMAHSNYMQVIAETGGIGLFVWMGLLYFSFKSLFFAYRTNAPPETDESEAGENLIKSLSRALLVSMLSFCFCTIFITMEIDLFYLLLGLCAATINIMNKEIKSIEIDFKLVDAGAICASIVGLLSFYHMYTR